MVDKLPHFLAERDDHQIGLVVLNGSGTSGNQGTDRLHHLVAERDDLPLDDSLHALSELDLQVKGPQGAGIEPGIGSGELLNHHAPEVFSTRVCGLSSRAVLTGIGVFDRSPKTTGRASSSFSSSRAGSVKCA